MNPVIASLLLAVFIALLGMGIISPNLPVYAVRLGATGLTLGMIVASFSITRGIMQPLVGGWSDRKGRKRFLVFGLAIYASAGLAYPFATTVSHLILIRLVHGIGSAMTIPMAMAYIGDLSPQGHEGRYMGMLNIAIFSGIGGGPLMGGLFRDLWGMNSAFYAMTLCTLSAMILVIVLLPREDGGERTYLAESLLVTFRRMLKDRKVMGVLASRMFTMTLMIPTVGFLPLLMTRMFDAGGLEIGMVLAVRTLVNASLQTPFGRLADRTNKLLLLMGGSAAICLGMVLVPSAANIYHLIAVFAFIGAAEAVVWPSLGAFAVESGRHYGQGSMMGLFNMAMSAGMLMGSVVSGSLMDLWGIGFAFYSIAVLLAAGTALAGWLIGSVTRR